MTTRRCRCINCIVPPHLLKKLLESPDTRIRDAAQRTLLVTSRLRGQRGVRGFAFTAAAPSEGPANNIRLRKRARLSRLATVARTEDGPPSQDDSVNRAFDGLGADSRFLQGDI